MKLLAAFTACVFISLPSFSFASDKRIALSFDDAPRADGPLLRGADRADQLVNALQRAETGPTVFFVTTDGFEDLPDGQARVEGYANAGHLIANHSHTHPWLSRTELEVYLNDIDRAAELLAPLPNTRPWFRFPYLDEGRGDRSKRDAMRKALAERGLLSGYVTIDTYDWHMDNRVKEAIADGYTVDHDALSAVYSQMVVDAAEHYAALSDEWLDRQPTHMLLLHENDLAALFIDDAVVALRQAGWTIVSPDEAFVDPLAQELPDTLFSGMGRVSALAYDNGARGADVFDHWSASKAGIDQRLEERGAFKPPLSQGPN